MKKTLKQYTVFMMLAALVAAGAACCEDAWAGPRIAIIDSGSSKYVDSAISFTSFPAYEDPLRHGTKVALLIRKENPTATIYMLQVCEKVHGTLKPSQGAIVQAIRWAIENEIDIVNMSLVTKYSPEIDRLVTEASVKHGIVFIAAAGNKSLKSHFAAGSDGYIRKKTKAVALGFPSSNPYVIAVGGLDSSGKVAHYSDKNCDIYADGEVLGQKGSSFASARITGRVSRIFTQNPQATKEVILSYLR